MKRFPALLSEQSPVISAERMGSVQHLQPPALQTLHVFNTQALTSLRKTLVTGMFTLERDFVVFLAGSHKLLGSICTLNIPAQPSH